MWEGHKIKKIFQVFLKLLKNVKTKFKIFLLFVAFSEYPNFNWKDRSKIEDLCRFTQTTNSWWQKNFPLRLILEKEQKKIIIIFFLVLQNLLLVFNKKGMQRNCLCELQSVTQQRLTKWQTRRRSLVCRYLVLVDLTFSFEDTHFVSLSAGSRCNRFSKIK